MDLTERLGFRADLNLDTGEINFQDVQVGKTLERKVHDMHPVLAEPIESGHNPIVHRIYRFIGDTPEIVNSALKFDITVVLPHPFGREFPKTTGHYHLPLPFIDSRGIPSPDFYQLIWGKGLILLQREKPNREVEASQVDAEEMQHVVIPPWMGHLAINIGQEPLVFADICVRTDHTNYKPYLERRGAAFYVTKENGQPHFVPNPNYPNPTIGILTPQEAGHLVYLRGKPLYTVLRDTSGALNFLTRPYHFMDLFSKSLR